MAVRLGQIQNFTEYPQSFRRQGAFPLDLYSIFETFEAAKGYAVSNNIAYVGQPIAVVTKESTTYYVIANEAGDLFKLGDNNLNIDNVDGRLKAIEEFFALEEGETFKDTLDELIELQNWITEHIHKITYTPKGSITKPVFTGTPATISMTGTPEGSISQAEFTGTDATISVSGTPEGTVSQPTFTGDELTSTGNYTPEGTISDITAEFAPTHGTVSYVTDVGSPSTMLATYDAPKQKLTLAFTKGSNITYSAVTVVTGGEVSVSKPTFTGTDATISVSGTPEGTVSQPTFSGNTLTSTGNYKPAGSINAQTFTGEKFTVTSNYTPAGSINELTFTGTKETLTTTVAKMPEVVTNG